MATMNVAVTARDLLDCLRAARIIGDGLVDQLITAHAGRELELQVEIDDEDLVDHARTSTLLAEAKDRWDYDGDAEGLDIEPFAEALTYTRRGDLALAGIMAARAFGPDHDLRSIERALQS